MPARPNPQQVANMHRLLLYRRGLAAESVARDVVSGLAAYVTMAVGTPQEIRLRQHLERTTGMPVAELLEATKEWPAD